MGSIVKRADMLECKYIATGHYAQIRYENSRYVVSKGLDHNKDQSYVLWGVSQECLKRTIFPVGSYHKDDIRKMAIQRGYSDLAAKSESYEICFIPDNDYRKFLKNRVKGLEENVSGGNFISTSGKILGQHDGYPFYTIGQRKIGISFGSEPTYVVGIDSENNTVTVGSKDDLKKNEMYIKDINYVKCDKIVDGCTYLVKVRYKHSGELATIFNDKSCLKVLFHNKVVGIAPGQSAVIYDGDDVVAGGFYNEEIILIFQIPYNSTGFFSPIIDDYLKGDSYLHNLVNHFPELENFEKQINEKRKQKVDRELLFNILSKQNQGINLSKLSNQNILSIKDENTFTVTTGHQLCLITGPLYFFYKIISTINLCEELKKNIPNTNLFLFFGWLQRIMILRR